MQEAQVIKFERKSKRRPTRKEHFLGLVALAAVVGLPSMTSSGIDNSLRRSTASAIEAVIPDGFSPERVVYTIPSEDEPYREVTISGMSTGGRYNSIGAIVDDMGERGQSLNYDEYPAMTKMLTEQNVLAQKARGVPEEKIKPTLVRPGDTFRIPVEFENIGKLITPEKDSIG